MPKTGSPGIQTHDELASDGCGVGGGDGEGGMIGKSNISFPVLTSLLFKKSHFAQRLTSLGP